MALTRPGTYVLCKKINQPLWPGIIYADDLAPSDIQRNRPSGYVTLVLLLGNPPQFEWATTTQLTSYLSQKQSNITPQTEQHRLAWETADFIRDAGLGLDYWRDVVNNDRRNDASQDPILSGSSDPELRGLRCDDDEEDGQLQEVLRISREACYRDATQPTPSSSPPKRNSRIGPRDVITIDTDSDEEDDLSSTPARRVPCFSPKRVRLSRRRDEPEAAVPIARKRNRDQEPERDQTAQQKKHRPSLTGPGQLLGQTSLGQCPSAPMSDTIEGDISESKDFVRIPVGPNRDIRTLLKKDVWNKPYFKDSRSGTNHFHYDDDGLWELRHPELVNINIEDFRFIAEYLTDHQFGLRHPDTTEQKKEAIAECVSAWQTAERLNMVDLLEHIVDKVQYLEWENEDVLTLAIIVYRSQGPSFDAHNRMREWISSFLAHHFWAFIKDAEIGLIFIKKLRRLPELERDVLVKRGKDLTAGTELDEDEESDEDD